MAELSVVIPVFNEAEQIGATLAAVREALRACDDVNAAFVLVDDGSSDRTWDAISGLAANAADVRGIRLSRNFGKEAALCAGSTPRARRKRMRAS